MTELDFVTGLMRENYDGVGFLPRLSVQDYLTRRGSVVALRKGYLLYENPHAYHALSVAQTCVEYDLRQRSWGRQMLEQVIAHGQANYASGIRLRCAEDLDANRFWQALGFEHIKTLTPNNARRRKILVWWLPLLPTLFAVRADPLASDG